MPAPPSPPYVTPVPESPADPVTTDWLREIADRTPPAPEDRASAPLRLFSTWEICRFILPMNPVHFRRVLRANPDLPQGRSASPEEAAARWFSLGDVYRLRQFFAGRSRQGKRYQPFRPEGPRGRVITVSQTGRGMGRTVTAHHLAVAAAIDGYRVLAIDLDPVGDLTAGLTGATVSGAGNAIRMFARHCGIQLQHENRRRLDRGEAPLPMDPAMDRAMGRSVADDITTTRWPGVDLLGAGHGLHRLAWQGPLWQAQVPGWVAWAALRDQLAKEGILARYDLIMIDTPADMGLLSVAALAVADMVLVPLTADHKGAHAGQTTLGQMAAVFGGIQDREDLAARALGQRATSITWQSVRLCLTGYDDQTQAGMAAAIQGTFGADLMPQRQALTALIGPGPGQVPCIYEADYRDSSRDRLVEARSSFDAFYAAIKAWMMSSWLSDIQS